MEDVLQRLGVEPFLNAHDTITRYGGSRMASATIEAMARISACFVDLDALQRTLGGQLAALTGNEDAYICAGAAAGVQLCAAVLLSRGDAQAYARLPVTDGRNEFIVQHGQYICYAKAIEAAGGRIRLVGDADGVTPDALRAAIGPQTAGVFCFPSRQYERASLPVWQVAEIAHERGVPVAVDAAALLPPKENLWRFTQIEGADMAVFSGGKTLCGPQASGLIVGKAAYMEDCRRFGAPAHGVCRAAKATREDMVGLRVAMEAFVREDEAERHAALSRRVDRLVAGLAGWGPGVARRVEHGSVGQRYPRVMVDMRGGVSAAQIVHAMAARHVFVGDDHGVLCMSPQNLTDAEAETVLARLWEAAAALDAKEEA